MMKFRAFLAVFLFWTGTSGATANTPQIDSWGIPIEIEADELALSVDSGLKICNELLKQTTLYVKESLGHSIKRSDCILREDHWDIVIVFEKSFPKSPQWPEIQIKAIKTDAWIDFTVSKKIDGIEAQTVIEKQNADMSFGASQDLQRKIVLSYINAGHDLDGLIALSATWHPVGHQGFLITAAISLDQTKSDAYTGCKKTFQ